jgi:hypothetical protein
MVRQFRKEGYYIGWVSLSNVALFDVRACPSEAEGTPAYLDVVCFA